MCARLGLRPAEASTQVIQRDRHAEYVATLALVASTLDKIATEIRHLARTEVREVQEPFAAGQKGSSAMPHKRNPVVCERVSGLARVIRGHAQAALENVALWHERDISHSSAERIIFPDATGLLAFMLQRRDLGARRARRVPRADAGERLSRAVGSRSASRCCSRSSTPGCRATTPTGSCSGPRPPRGTRTRASARRSRPIPRSGRTLDDAALAELFDPRRFLRNLGGGVREAREAPGGRILSPVSATGGLHAQGKVRDVYDAGPGRPPARGHRPPQRLRRDPAEPDPRQGPGADGLLAVLVRADERPRRQPPAHRRTVGSSRRRSATSRSCRGAPRSCKRAEVVPIECVARGYLSGSGWKQYRERGSVCGVDAARRARRVRPPARADLHAHDEGRRGPRPAGHARRDRRPGRARARREAEGAHPRASTSGSPRWRSSAA